MAEDNTADWEDTLITTTADKLLEYIAEHGDTPAKDVAAALGLGEDVVENWADALAEAGLLETTYTSRGLILKQPEEPEEAIDERVEEVKQRVAEQVDVEQKHLDQEGEQVAEARETLKRIGAILQKDREESKSLKQRIQTIEEQEETVANALQEQREKHESLEEEVNNVLETVTTSLDDVEAAEDAISEFTALRSEVEEELDVIQELLRQKEKVEEAAEKLDDVKEKESRIDTVLNELHTHLNNLLPHQDTETAEEPGEYTCGTCSKSFDTERGLNVHKSKVHK